MTSIMSRLADVLRRHARRGRIIACQQCVCLCVCAFGKVVCDVEVDLSAGGGLWSGEDVLESL